MNQSIGKEFKFFSLISFALPSIIMMIFTSLYTMVDGMFVSRYVSTFALSAVNIVYPLINVVIAIGVMLATGGSAIIAKKMGEDKFQKARETFSSIILTGIVISIVMVVLGSIFMDPLLKMLGANDNLYPLCYDYQRIIILFTPVAILQLLFQYFFVTAGKPGIGLLLTIVGGFTNMILDYIFIVPLNGGIAGAALATGIGMCIPAIFGLLYFTFNRKGMLYIVRPKFDIKIILQTCSNGSSEMVSNIALAMVTLLYNIIMMRLLGEDGVAAITIMMYAQFFLNAVFLGFSMGVAPIISYKYGKKDVSQVKKIFRYCIGFSMGVSVFACISSVLAAPLLILVFAEKGSNVYQIALDGFALFSLNYLFAGINIFASAMFTAFSNGKVSATISFLRTFVFIVAGLILLPMIFGVNGVWVALTIAELLTILVSIRYFKKYHSIYQYI